MGFEGFVLGLAGVDLEAALTGLLVEVLADLARTTVLVRLT